METLFNNYISTRKTLVEDYLGKNIKGGYSPLLIDAMRYSILGGGKRLRAILFFAGYESITGNTPHHLINIAAGIECIHMMSLIHDDLPCMDDDDMRRGKATCHKKFDEATALIAGDALLIKGTELILSTQNLDAETILQINKTIMKSIGIDGMCAGQMLDWVAMNKSDISLDQLNNIHRAKTGELIKASIVSGVIAAKGTPEQINTIQEYADNIGLAFQIADDILDITGNTEDMGKTLGKDQSQNKATYPTILGLENSKKVASELISKAKSTVQYKPLINLADYIIQRTN